MLRQPMRLLPVVLLFACAAAGGKRGKKARRSQSQNRADGDASRAWQRAADRPWENTSSVAGLRCSVARRPASEVTAEIFREEYDLQRPVILTGAAEAWKVPTAPFSRAALLALAAAGSAGSADVLAGLSSSITKHHGAGHRRVPLRQLIEHHMGEAAAVTVAAGRDPLAAFDNGVFLPQHPSLQRSLIWPPIYPKERGGQTFFSMGPAGGVRVAVILIV